MKLRFLLPVLVFGALVATFALMLRRTGEGEYDPKLIRSPLLGKPAPAFALPQVEDPTKIVSSKDFAGRMYVLNVWGTWCVGCRQEHAALLAIAQQGLVPLVGLDTKDELADAQRWLSQLGNPYVATAFDADGRIGIDWGVYGAPETFLVDARGVVIHKHIGPLSLAAWQRQFVPLIEQGKRSASAKVGS
jgi:cytochrome c biogenesis protein CcmG, thiol:disulfide interchange protein DsbE